MRVLSGVLVLFLLCGSQAMAQGVSWGVKGGVNLATLSSDQDPGPDFKYRIGLVAGGFFTWPIGSRLDVQPEVLFSQQGASFDAPDLGSVIIKLDSLVTPILVRYKLSSSSRGLVLFGGPSFGFKLTAKATAESSGQKTTDDIGDELESFDYGVVFGAGWEAGRLTIDGRYTWGLSALGKDQNDPEKITHRVIAVMAGIRF
jgi:Outer membrane protein beta-barrel domain